MKIDTLEMLRGRAVEALNAWGMSDDGDDGISETTSIIERALNREGAIALTNLEPARKIWLTVRLYEVARDEGMDAALMWKLANA